VDAQKNREVVVMSGKRASLRACAYALALFTLLCLTAAPAFALPQERAYEMVSPVYKGGYGILGIKAVAPDGESVAFASNGTFAASPGDSIFNGYIAQRGTSGWTTEPLTPPSSIAPFLGLAGVPTDYSSTLESTLTLTRTGPNRESAENSETEEFLLHHTDEPDTLAGDEVAGMPLMQVNDRPLRDGFGYRGASQNFSHILISTYAKEALLPLASELDGTKSSQLYDLTTTGTPSLRLVAVQDNGELIDPYCNPKGGSTTGRESNFNAVSADGATIFFTENANLSFTNETKCDATFHNETNPANPALLWARVNGEKTLEISAPVAADCAESAPCHSAASARAEFDGANEEGTKVFFTSAQPLVNGDTDSSPNLYMATIGCPEGAGEACAPAAREVTSMVQVSHDPHAGQAAEVQGFLSISPDGSRVYFVARGALSEGPNAEGLSPVSGADNLYMYDSDTGKASFIAELCSGAELSGTESDTHCPANGQRNDMKLWEGNGSEAQTSNGEGQYLVFSSYAQLVAGDDDSAQDVYRYDALTGSLQRVSTGEAGYDANGNNSAFNASIAEGSLGYAEEDMLAQTHNLGTRAISEDGSRIVFTSAEPLSPAAVNGLVNAYEWYEAPGSSEGRVSLISTGSSQAPVEEVTISPSGRDVFFITTQGLVPQDTDGVADLYDARIGGGFPSPPAPVQPCTGDACQGPLTNPAPLLVPGSVSQAAGGNFSAPASSATPKSKAKPVACKKGFLEKKGKCVKKPKAKKKAKKSAHRDRRAK
jgi:hypothetical protein